MPEVIKYKCGHCDANICVTKGEQHHPGLYYLPKCYNCNLPTIITENNKRYPPSGLPITVKGLPEGIGKVYKEIKNCPCYRSLDSYKYVSTQVINECCCR